VVDPKKATKVEVVEGSSLKINVGESVQLTAQVSPETAETTLKWSSSSKKIATVDANGVITPVKEGTATITVKTANGKKDTLKVKVVDPYKPSKVVLNLSGTQKIAVGKTVQLSATIEPDTASSDLTWKSSKKSVATVDENGLVKAKSKGTATITVTARGGVKDTVKISVYSPADSYTELSSYMGKSMNKFKAKFGLYRYDWIYAAYRNSVMAAGTGQNNYYKDDKIRYIELDAPCSYKLCGIYIGMDMEAACDHLKSKGWEITRHVGKYFVAVKGKYSMWVDSASHSGKDYGGVSNVSYSKYK